MISCAVGTLNLFLAILLYMAKRDTGKEPLFFEDEHLLTRESLWQGCGKCCSRLALTNKSTAEIALE